MSGQKIINPIPADAQNAAAQLVRSKLATIYADEPAALEEEKEIAAVGAISKHQQFMADLMAKGLSLVDIQTKWHAYYQSLPDREKHEVWQEFYEQHSRAKAKKAATTPVLPHVPMQELETKIVELKDELADQPSKRPTTMADLHRQIVQKASANGKLTRTHHVKSIAVSLLFASLVTSLLFFVTNNERFIAPFIQPSRNASAAPIITDGSSVSAESKLIIPKINLEAPLITDVVNNSEDAIQAALESGVVLYPATGKPGEKANPTFFGHSSNNLFNKGAYKFVFVRLNQLEVGDTYAINFGGKQYVYKIFSRDVVSPDQVDVLYAHPKESMSTLITCEPPGTSNTRLVLHAEQISPDPAANAAATATPDSAPQPKEIPSNAPSFLRQLFGL